MSATGCADSRMSDRIWSESEASVGALLLCDAAECGAWEVVMLRTRGGGIRRRGESRDAKASSVTLDDVARALAATAAAAAVLAVAGRKLIEMRPLDRDGAKGER